MVTWSLSMASACSLNGILYGRKVCSVLLPPTMPFSMFQVLFLPLQMREASIWEDEMQMEE